MSEPTINTEADLASALSRISITGPFRPFGWQWRIRTMGEYGWAISATFKRPDRGTDNLETGYTREEMIKPGSTESQLFKTAWVIFELSMRHEAMESFRVDNILVFDPHRTIAQLQEVDRGG